MKLSTSARKSLPKKVFAGPGRSFPIPDKSHARAPISGATRAERAGNISPSTEASIKAKARKKLGSSGDSGKSTKVPRIPKRAAKKALDPHNMTHDQFLKL